jgi:hypothetical protein
LRAARLRGVAHLHSALMMAGAPSCAPLDFVESCIPTLH